MSKANVLIEGKTFRIEKYGDNMYSLYFFQNGINIVLGEEEMRDIADTFMKLKFDE